jgi:hypothetical protein
VRHAGAAALDSIEDLLVEIRAYPGLRERKLGVFYHRSSAFLHFHEDPQGMFADLKLGDRFTRFAVSAPADRRRFVDALAVAAGGLA